MSVSTRIWLAGCVVLALAAVAAITCSATLTDYRIIPDPNDEPHVHIAEPVLRTTIQSGCFGQITLNGSLSITAEDLPKAVNFVETQLFPR